ncbi:hypothetical protein [Treponema sp. UBA3813]|uniref:hypothetical protein n=1 Tax=Treponema sp. UBA3813 TaxID=1947715 RepID=UPI0025F7E1F1|nr:hypothetical protein [Treponema sp. UBA3813]
MKAPANFTASATKKINPLEAAINSNFSQGSPKGSVRQTGENPSPEARGGLSAGARAESGENTLPKSNSAAISEEKSQIPNGRREVKEKFLVSMSKGERSVFKAFCAMQNVSMNHFVMCAMDYFKEDLENGKVSLSAHSYKRKES